VQRRQKLKELLKPTSAVSLLILKLFKNQELIKMAPKKRKPAAKPLSAAVEKNLREKAKNSRFTLTQLKAVYRRGQGAYLSGGSRNVSMAAWAMGRVNSFISGKGGARKADADIMRRK
tara:strand:- start:34 stop:387 length:354 start_codon:yes stop_codon:yes gene_type:complete